MFFRKISGVIITDMQRIDCRKCRFFYVTWEPSHPYGCRFFGFKGPGMPSQTVFQSSGAPCAQFEPKFPKPSNPEAFRD